MNDTSFPVILSEAKDPLRFWQAGPSPPQPALSGAEGRLRMTVAQVPA